MTQIPMKVPLVINNTLFSKFYLKKTENLARL